MPAKNRAQPLTPRRQAGRSSLVYEQVSRPLSPLIAEGVGFEPTRTRQRPSGFQDRRHRPLGEPSWCRVQPLTPRTTEGSGDSLSGPGARVGDGPVPGRKPAGGVTRMPEAASKASQLPLSALLFQVL